MRSITGTLTAVLLSSLAAPASASPPLAGVVPSYCLHTDDGYRCVVGPFDVAKGERLEAVTGIAALSEAGHITSATPKLVDGAGKPLSHHVVHLHHAVWLNPYRDDLTCDSYDGFLPDHERFFAAGKELSALKLPRGYGYRWDPGLSQPYTQSAPWWEFVVHLDGIHGSSEVYIELEIGFIPDSAGRQLTAITPVWLDMRNCSSDPVYTVRKGSGANGMHKEGWSYKMPAGGRFVFLGGHLHDGGLRLSLHNVTAGEHLYTSRAVYASAKETWFLTGMTTRAGAPGPHVNEGDVLKLTAIYDTSRTWRDVMGIMVGALVTDTS